MLELGHLHMVAVDSDGNVARDCSGFVGDNLLEIISGLLRLR